MKLGVLRLVGASRVTLLLSLGPALLGLCTSMAQTQSQNQSQSQSQSQSQTQSQAQPVNASSSTTPADDAAAKAAERKKRFDEQRKLLESGVVPPKEEGRLKSDPDLVLSPIEVNLLVHERVAFHLYDKGKEVSGGSWGVVPGRILGSWFDHGIFTVEAKSPGTARVGVMIGSSRYANVIVTVYPGTKLPKGIERTADFTPQADH
jgi:hypothetical protein